MAASSLRDADVFSKSRGRQRIRITSFQAPLVRNRPQWRAAVSRRESESMQKSRVAPLPTLCVRIDLDTEARIGPGKIQLLEKVQSSAQFRQPRRDEYVRIIVLAVDDPILVNALQRSAAVVLQKSTRECFGLTVTEAMWKGAAVTGGDVGGIRHQIKDEMERVSCAYA